MLKNYNFMKKQINLLLSITFFVCFVVWTILVKNVDVASIGPNGSLVGLSSLNNVFVSLIGNTLDGSRSLFYDLTEVLFFLPILGAVFFVVLAIIQLIQRKSLLKVDKPLINLGIFFILVIGFYIFFECVIINYRPMLIDGELEASYPSSHTFITLFMGLSYIYLTSYYLHNNKTLKIILISIIGVLGGVIILGRILSGVHYMSDIIGGILLGLGLYFAYAQSLNNIRVKN